MISPATVEVSSPGKLILLGEHAAVYHRPALVAATDLRLRATLTRQSGAGVELDLGDIGHRESASWESIRRYAREVAGRWEAFSRHPDPAGFRALRGDDPAHLVKIALGETAAALESQGYAVPGLALRVVSDLPIGSGFGSSAATSVAVVAGLRRLAGAPDDRAVLEELALTVERRQHGNPSGVDTATTLEGGVIWAQKLADGTLRREKIEVRSPLLSRLRIFDSGMPSEPTGEVVAAVRALRDRDPELMETLFDEIAAITRSLRRELQSPAEDAAEITRILRSSQACLEELGVVPEPVRRIVRRIEQAGGAAKISGAGSLAGPGAGCLLVYHSDADWAAAQPFLRELRALPLSLGAEGFRLEDEDPR